jgi:hypothetical protein
MSSKLNRRSTRSNSRGASLRLEVLEDRTVPSTLFGTGSSVVLGPAVPLGTGTWTPDRYQPAGFTSGQAGGGRVGVLDEFISHYYQDGSRPGYNTSFYNFQGRAQDLAAGTTYISVDLYVPDSWATLSQQDHNPGANPAGWGSLASLWATGRDASGNISSYPIIGFNNDGTNNSQTGTMGFQVYDQTNGWTNVRGFTGADQWYNLGIGIRADGQIDYYVNGKVVYTDAAGNGTTVLSNVMLQGYNGGNDYHISWDNLRTTQDANRAFVQGLYQDLLGRDGSTDAGVNGWVGMLNAGAARTDVVTDILNSAEYRGLQVDHFYQEFLGREADAAGRAGWIKYLQQGGTEEGLTVAILTSAEYQAKRPDNGDFVRSLYDQLLFRGASDAEVASWVNDLNGGASRADVAREILHSQEATLRAVDTAYTYLHRDADPAGEAAFASMLQRPDGKAMDAMVAVLASNEYWGRFSA